MEKLDQTTADRVWQRVLGEQSQSVQEQTLLAAEAETAVQLEKLIRYFPGKRKLLQSMLTQTRNHLACLQGLHLLRRGAKLHTAAGHLRNTDTTALIRKCYVNCLNLAGKYAAAAEDPEYGIVFAEMAQTKRRHCAQLLSLLGSGK